MQITLMIPDLFALPASAIPAREAPAWQPLLRWLARTEPRTLVAGMEAALLELAGQPRDPARDVPAGAIGRVGEGGVTQYDGYWLRADPVHLRADRDRVLLFSPAQLDIHADEAQALCAELNRFFAADGWHFDAPHPQRWYLHVNDDPQIRSYDLAEVVARAIAEFMPRGRGAAPLSARLTEAQMLLHASAVNQTRIAKGMLPINSLWLWGSGALPQVKTLPWTTVYSDEPFARGLAQLGGIPALDLPDGGAPALVQLSTAQRPSPTTQAAHALIVCDTLRTPLQRGEAGEFLGALHAVCDEWIAPIYEAVGRGRLSRATLASSDGRAFDLTRAAARKFWRRTPRYRDCAR